MDVFFLDVIVYFLEFLFPAFKPTARNSHCLIILLLLLLLYYYKRAGILRIGHLYLVAPS